MSLRPRRFTIVMREDKVWHDVQLLSNIKRIRQTRSKHVGFLSERVQIHGEMVCRTASVIHSSSHDA